MFVFGRVFEGDVGRSSREGRRGGGQGLLPPPLHVGSLLREKKVDFQLPYDIYWLHQAGMVSVACLTKVLSPLFILQSTGSIRQAWSVLHG